MVITKELKIPEEYFDSSFKSDKILIKRLTFGEQLRIQDEGSKIRPGKETTASQEIFAVSLITKSVIEAPWELNNPSIIASLDVGLGTWLLNEVAEFNKITDKKKVISETLPEVG